MFLFSEKEKDFQDSFIKWITIDGKCVKMKTPHNTFYTFPWLPCSVLLNTLRRAISTGNVQ